MCELKRVRTHIPCTMVTTGKRDAVELVCSICGLNEKHYVIRLNNKVDVCNRCIDAINAATCSITYYDEDDCANGYPQLCRMDEA